ncbi:hypothetical protein AAA060_09125, partial [Bifidobacterium adolescentis]|uniref:hypothetical protein n=1 Tax=Bifidobacterium adolescentis TaxID=1680 RepID=UPI0032BFE521
QPAGSELIIVPWTGTTLSAQTFGHYHYILLSMLFSCFIDIVFFHRLQAISKSRRQTLILSYPIGLVTLWHAAFKIDMGNCAPPENSKILIC